MDSLFPLRAYRSSFKKEVEIKEQTQNLLQDDFIKEICSPPYSPPVILVLKKEEGKKIELCVNLCKLNAIMKTDAKLLPWIDKLSKLKCFFNHALGKWIIGKYIFNQKILKKLSLLCF